MTATTETATTRTCPPSDVADMIVPWPDVQPGDLVLWDGELLPVKWTEPLPGHPDQTLVMLADGSPATIPVGTRAAVRRYTESGDDDALVLAALDEAAADRDERARSARQEGRTDEEQEHLGTASQYRAERDRLEAGRG